MHGVWSLAVNLSGSNFRDGDALAQIIIEVLFLVVVTVSVYFLPARADRIQLAFDNIVSGARLLVAWYLLQVVDLFLHEARLQAAYVYILFYFFIAFFKFIADILILHGTHRVLACRLYGQLQTPIIWVLVGEFLNIVLVISALYHLGSYLGNEVLWLNVADQGLTNDISSRKDAFATAFFVVQFFFALLIFAGSLISAWLWRRDSDEMTLPKEVYYAVGATATLWIRSFSELIIVQQYEQHNTILNISTSTARGFVYGLCTVGFLILIAPLGRSTSAAPPQDPTAQAVEHDCQTYIQTAITDKTSVGQRAPELQPVFRTMRASPGAVVSAGTMQLLQAANSGQPQMTPVLDYIGRLEVRYADWQPL